MYAAQTARSPAILGRAQQREETTNGHWSTRALQHTSRGTSRRAADRRFQSPQVATITNTGTHCFEITNELHDVALQRHEAEGFSGKYDDKTGEDATRGTEAAELQVVALQRHEAEGLSGKYDDKKFRSPRGAELSGWVT